MPAAQTKRKRPAKGLAIPGGAQARTRTTSVAEAKAGLSSLLREVEQRRTEITLVRRGVPVARLVPMEQPKGVVGFGWMAGTVTELGDIVGPSGEAWEVADEVREGVSGVAGDRHHA